jgi:hypothetical protein
MSWCNNRLMGGFVEELEVVIRKYMVDAMPPEVRSGAITAKIRAARI